MIYLLLAYPIIGLIFLVITMARHWDVVVGEMWQDDLGVWRHRKWSKRVIAFTVSIMVVLFMLGWPLFAVMAIKDHRKGLRW